MGQVHVLTGIFRRRRWSEEQKRSLVAEAFAPGVVLADVVRRAEINSGQLYRWRKELRSATTGFAQVVVSANLPAVASGPEPTIEVMAGSGGQVRMPVSVSPDLASAIVRALVGR